MNIAYLLLAPLAIVVSSQAAYASPLAGVWTEVDGPGAARIAPCAVSGEKLCARGLEKRRDGTLSANAGATVLTDVQAKGKHRWSGTYLNGKQKLPATLKLINADLVEMRVCMAGIICQTARYRRYAQ